MQNTDCVKVVLKVSQDADVKRGNSLFVHYILAFEERSAQLLKLLKTFCHVTDLHSITDGLNDVGQFLKPVNQFRDIKQEIGESFLIRDQKMKHTHLLSLALRTTLLVSSSSSLRSRDLWGKRTGEAHHQKARNCHQQ